MIRSDREEALPAAPRRTGDRRPLRAVVASFALGLLASCGLGQSEVAEEGATEEERLAVLRERMIEDQVAARGVRNLRVLEALRAVRRHRYAEHLDPRSAYADSAHAIGLGQTISQPYIVALMSELAAVEPPCRVLEVGTGSGYQAAVLAEMGCEVWSIEIIPALAERARETLVREGYGERVHVRAGDGYRGWPEEAPFDAILVTAAAPRVPEPLLEQLAIGARLVVPVGEPWQMLEVHHRTPDGFEVSADAAVRFVPMTGEVRAPR